MKKLISHMILSVVWSIAQSKNLGIRLSSYESSYATLNYYLQTLESDAGMPRLALNAEGYCYFSIGDSPLICIYLMPNGDDVQLSTYVFDEELFLKPNELLQLLSWNFSSNFLHNSIIGYCDTTRRLTLKLNLHIQRVDETNLYNLCQNFGADLIKLREKIKELAHHQPPAPQAVHAFPSHRSTPPQSTSQKNNTTTKTAPNNLFWMQI